MSNRMVKSLRGAAWAALLVLVLAIGLAGVYRVDSGEQAVVLTFGEATDTRGPGMYWHIPVVQQVMRVSTTQIHSIEFGFRTDATGNKLAGAAYSDVLDEATMITGDQNIIQVEAVYQVVVKDVFSYLFEVDDPFHTMHCAFESTLRRNIQSRSLDDALLNKSDIEGQVLPDFRRALEPYHMGVEVREVRIQNITVPHQVAAAYEDVNNAMNEKTQKLDEAERYYNEVVPRARADAYAMVQQASAFQAQTVADAQGEVSQFSQVLEKYKANPAITRKRLLIETLESILGKADKLYIVDENSSRMQILDLNESTRQPAPSAPVQE